MSHHTRPRVRPGALATTVLVTLATSGLAACSGGSEGGPSAPTAFAKTAGDNVQAAVAAATPAAPTLRVNDANGRGVRGVIVNFTVTAGGGSIAATVDTTDASGVATAGMWTLGTVAGQHTVTATSPTLPGTSAVFTATATATAPAKLVFATQPAANATAGTPFQGPVVEIQDAYGNRTTSTATVSVGVTNGGAPITLTGETSIAAVDGRATFGLLSTNASGTLTMVASSPNLATALSNAITVASGPPASLVKMSTDVQLGGAGNAVFLAPMVKVVDSQGNAIAGTTVSFTVQAGGGSVTGGDVTTDAQGIARVGAWILGGATGENANVLRATAGALTADFTATAAAPSDFHVELRYLTAPTQRQREAFERAWLGWRRIITGDLPDGSIPNPIDIAQCNAQTTIPGGTIIDDLVIYVTLRNIDGPGNVLGSAGPCLTRTTGSRLTAVGTMTFDTSDLASLEGAGQLDQVVLHEMGHVLGIGSLWNSRGFTVGYDSDSASFNGAAASAVWAGLGGTTANRVPVENCVGIPGCGTGTKNSHWRESTFRTELMTGYLNGGVANPLSALTIASLQDIGYTVDMSRAEAYTLPTAPAPGSVRGSVLSAGQVRAIIEAPLPPPRAIVGPAPSSRSGLK